MTAQSRSLAQGEHEDLDSEGTSVTHDSSRPIAARSLPKDLTLSLLASALVICSLLYFLGSWQTGSWWPPFRKGSQVDWEPTARIAIPAAALLGAVAAGVVAWHGQLTREQELSAKRDADLVDRYSKAIDQLASVKESVRLGGLYALERLMSDSDRDVAPIREVLAAHARMWFAELDRRKLTGRDRVPIAEDVRTCMKILARTRSDTNPSYDLTGINATAVDLSGTDLRGADLRDANLERALLLGADLRGANLARVTAKDAILVNATAVGVIFAGASLTGAVLTDADLSGADLRNADARRARFVRTVLVGADLTRTNLKGANLHRAELRGAQLRRTQLNHADCTGADLRGATILNANLASANFGRADLAETQIVANCNLTDADFSGAQLLLLQTDGGASISDAAVSERISQLQRENRSWRRARWDRTVLENAAQPSPKERG